MNDFNRLVKRFKKAFPEYKVHVRRMKLPDGLAGDCGYYKNKKDEYIIRINNKMTQDEQYFWLSHEFAHVGRIEDKDDHSIYWARKYAKCYKIYEQFVTED